MTLQDDRPSAVTVAREARELISNPDRWTTGAYARTASGEESLSRDPCAAQWCALGAHIRPKVPPRVRRAVAAALRRAARELRPGDRGGPATANDQGGHAVVMAMYDRAIELLEQEAAETEEQHRDG
jgi:hypothetical protein